MNIKFGYWQEAYWLEYAFASFLNKPLNGNEKIPNYFPT